MDKNDEQLMIVLRAFKQKAKKRLMLEKELHALDSRRNELYEELCGLGQNFPNAAFDAWVRDENVLMSKLADDSLPASNFTLVIDGGTIASASVTSGKVTIGTPTKLNNWRQK